MKLLVPLLGPDGGIDPPFGRNPRSRDSYSVVVADVGSAGISSLRPGRAGERDWWRSNLAEEEETEMRRMRVKRKKKMGSFLKSFAIEERNKNENENLEEMEEEILGRYEVNVELVWFDLEREIYKSVMEWKGRRIWLKRSKLWFFLFPFFMFVPHSQNTRPNFHALLLAGGDTSPRNIWFFFFIISFKYHLDNICLLLMFSILIGRFFDTIGTFNFLFINFEQIEISTHLSIIPHIFSYFQFSPLKINPSNLHHSYKCD